MRSSERRPFRYAWRCVLAHQPRRSRGPPWKGMDEWPVVAKYSRRAAYLASHSASAGDQTKSTELRRATRSADSLSHRAFPRLQ